MRQQVISIVERHLGAVRKFTGESNVVMKCPFHKGGQETKPSFSINVDLGIFHCFTCKASGAIPQLLTMLGLSKDQVDLEVHEIREDLEANRLRLAWRARSKWVGKDSSKAPSILPEALLRPYEWCPTKLVEYGLNQDWLRYMEVGYDRQQNRITFPVRDVYGNLAGIVGGSAVAGQYPKYKVYKGKWKNPATGEMVPSDFGTWFEESYPNYDFHNHHYLWNYNRLYPRLFFGREENPTLIIVEGFKACLWLLQNGFWNTVALMGSAMTTDQLDLLRRLQVNLVLFLDNDEAGILGTLKIGRRLYSEKSGVFVAQYPQDAVDCQPDDLSPGEVGDAVTRACVFPQYQKETRRWT
jgi:DNA primase